MPNSEIKPIAECSNRKVARIPKPMAVEVRVIVRNVQADSFEDAKLRARVFARQHVEGSNLGAYAGRECDGTYTVEFR